ncbi:hypothetical protein D5F01_LYC07768 [Larimichthys crocea]|uniref:Immunoglobulin V-set domain-containing protein n=1 Tax=Larimichthys crocea TaxID=215358 RepID=A0A6G0IN21_LARCR|nr:hypothetical protein D5F01_LYC07768 [Larimichthys crocea]
MSIHHVLFFCFVSALCGGDSVSAKLNIYAGAAGGNGSLDCYLSSSGRTKFFCKDECEAKDILIKTDEVRAQSGRYSTTYRNNSSGEEILSVTITHLIKSDSGRYRSGLGKNLVPDSYCDFEVRVLDEVTTSDTGWYRCGYGRALSPDSYYDRDILVLTAKLDGNEEEVTTIYKRPGGNIIVQCSFTNSEDRKYFCKDGCEEKDVLFETTGVRVQKDRYSIEFLKGSSTAGSLYVGITQLNKSDSGLYRCVLDISLSLDPIRKFNIIVTDPTTSKPPSAFTTPVPSSSTLTSTQSDQQLTGTTPSPGVLSVIVILVIAVIIMGLALMIICIQRNNRPDGLRTRGNSDGTNMEVYDHENCPAVHNHEDSTYQNLNPATMDEDQIYSALTHT